MRMEIEPEDKNHIIARHVTLPFLKKKQICLTKLGFFVENLIDTLQSFLQFGGTDSFLLFLLHPAEQSTSQSLSVDFVVGVNPKPKNEAQTRGG